MQQAVIAGYVRTPFTFARKGALAGVRPDDLAAIAIKALVERTGIDPATLEDVLLGCAYPEAAQGNNIARIASLLAGLPIEVAGATVNRFCGSSMSAIHIAAGQIAIGAGDAFIAGGVESMTQVPQGGFNFSPNPSLLEAYISMGETAENVAAQYGVSRAAQEELAFASQQKAAQAQAAGRLRDEIVGVMTEAGLIDADGCLRPQTTLEGLAGLKPAFRPDGTVTAGTASPLTDGASATLVTSEAYAQAHGLEPMARIRAVAVAGCPPEIMGMGPVPATRKALARAGLTIDDIDVVEINEAFGSQAVACIRELGIPLEKVNIDGGGLSIGHPLGATGARITGKAAQILKRESKRYALSTQCIGGGQGVATILEAA
ncbi:MAG: thiolase family protein [Alphaproteobacteria bacterium]|nr:thiolase family protein [Alphaproteobacteria bacterium]MBU1516013.1 thiolase family protein [Alphaproteobacteria bacterium]MBU2092772.1 thiolase family protein [Alphaproteobacteria bacterium]MBU2153703.1 thiolase family protein [Alphaproteobacteria bacterium]MBU2308331.1 thiolase family protein [Alphaproteobacteria bacterium]